MTTGLESLSDDAEGTCFRFGVDLLKTLHGVSTVDCHNPPPMKIVVSSPRNTQLLISPILLIFPE